MRQSLSDVVRNRIALGVSLGQAREGEEKSEHTFLLCSLALLR